MLEFVITMNKLTGIEEVEATNWMNEAARVAVKGLCLRAKCGSVVVKNGKMIGQGYNSPPQDNVENRMCDKDSCCCHAEWRAIIQALKENPNEIEGSQLYFTRVDDQGKLKKSGKPYCTVCSRLALDVGISYFVLWHEEGICSYPTNVYNLYSYQNSPKI